MSTFHGLEMAKQALFAQQGALYTTGNNISNANTDGYSRQRVNFETMNPYPTASRNRPQIPGEMGTGVEIGTIQRIRNEFLDHQFRGENNKAGYWNTLDDGLSRMENLLNEPSDSGLSKTMSQFWTSLQDLAGNPDQSGARSVVANRALAVTETLNHLSKSLHSIQNDIKKQIDDGAIKSTNSILRQINELNGQVQNVEAHGHLANDLYDKRDQLIDELSGIINIKVTSQNSGGRPLEIADGLVEIELLNGNGTSFDEPILLTDKQVAGEERVSEKLQINYAEDGEVNSISVAGYGDELEVTDFLGETGSLNGLIDSYGYTDGDEIKGIYSDMIGKLDQMAEGLADEFNRVHGLGKDVDGNPGIPFFVFTDEPNGAGEITVNEKILDHPSKIAAGSMGGGSENGDNALALADVFEENKLDELDDMTINSYYESLIGNLGVDAQEANRMSENVGMLTAQVEEQRMSISAVSLDEEMTNMIKFQHAYNAAARSMTTIDEMLDQIINGMGLVGR